MVGVGLTPALTMSPSLATSPALAFAPIHLRITLDCWDLHSATSLFTLENQSVCAIMGGSFGREHSMGGVFADPLRVNGKRGVK